MVKVCVYVSACEPHCGQSSVTGRHPVPLPSECVGLTVHSCVWKSYFKVAEWIFRHFFFSAAESLVPLPVEFMYPATPEV